MDIGNIFFGSGRKFDSLKDINEDLVTFFLNSVFVIAGVILIFYFILGGIGMMAAAGGSDPQKAEQAKKTITSAIIGLVVVITAFWIVKLINSLLFGLGNSNIII